MDPTKRNVFSSLGGDVLDYLQKHKEKALRDLAASAPTLENLLIIKGEVMMIHRMESDFREKKTPGEKK